MDRTQTTIWSDRSFPCQDPRLASGENQLGGHKSRFKGPDGRKFGYYWYLGVTLMDDGAGGARLEATITARGNGGQRLFRLAPARPRGGGYRRQTRRTRRALRQQSSATCCCQPSMVRNS